MVDSWTIWENDCNILINKIYKSNSKIGLLKIVVLCLNFDFKIESSAYNRIFSGSVIQRFQNKQQSSTPHVSLYIHSGYNTLVLTPKSIKWCGYSKRY